MSLVGAIICGLYPLNWHQDIPSGGFGTMFILFTVVVGMVIFFASVRAWGMVISPSLEAYEEDFIDDLAALYRWLKVHLGRLSALLVPLEKILGSSVLRPVVNWLNPRKNRWYGIALVGILTGAMLAFGETGLHTPVGRIEIFAGVECLALLMGYAFFVKPLWLVRSE